MHEIIRKEVKEVKEGVTVEERSDVKEREEF